MQSYYEKIRGGLKSTLIILFVGFCKLLRNNVLRGTGSVKFYLCVFACRKQTFFQANSARKRSFIGLTDCWIFRFKDDFRLYTTGKDSPMSMLIARDEKSTTIYRNSR